MDRRSLSPENLNERPQKRAEQQSSDVPFLDRLQELRNYHLRTTIHYLEQARTNEAFTSGLDKPSERQTEDCSSGCKEASVLILSLWLRVGLTKREFQAQFSAMKSRILREGYSTSALPNVWDKGKCRLPTEEERWLKSIPIGPDGKRAPKVVELSTTFTSNHLVLVGGMNEILT